MNDTALPGKLEPGEARERGFTVDTTCYPWFAFKGPRFAPTEKRECFTDDEAALRVACWQYETGIAEMEAGHLFSGQAHFEHARALTKKVGAHG